MPSTSSSSRRGRPADLQARAERRDQILAAARSCFVKRGFHASTTAEISQEAAISVAGLYQYFPSKEDLILALVEQDLADTIDRVDRLAAHEDFFDGAEQILQEAIDEDLHQAWSRIRLEILAEASRSAAVSEMVASADQRFVTALAGAIRSAQTKGQIQVEIDPNELSVVLTCLSDGLFGRLSLPPSARGPFVSASVKMLRRAAATA